MLACIANSFFLLFFFSFLTIFPTPLWVSSPLLTPCLYLVRVTAPPVWWAFIHANPSIYMLAYMLTYAGPDNKITLTISLFINY